MLVRSPKRAKKLPQLNSLRKVITACQVNHGLDITLIAAGKCAVLDGWIGLVTG